MRRNYNYEFISKLIKNDYEREQLNRWATKSIRQCQAPLHLSLFRSWYPVRTGYYKNELELF